MVQQKNAKEFIEDTRYHERRENAIDKIYFLYHTFGWTMYLTTDNTKQLKAPSRDELDKLVDRLEDDAFVSETVCSARLRVDYDEDEGFVYYIEL